MWGQNGTVENSRWKEAGPGTPSEPPPAARPFPMAAGEATPGSVNQFCPIPEMLVKRKLEEARRTSCGKAGVTVRRWAQGLGHRKKYTFRMVWAKAVARVQHR